MVALVTVAIAGNKGNKLKKYFRDNLFPFVPYLAAQGSML
jgi:hypothetical protein